MKTSASTRQPDLFADNGNASVAAPPPADFVERIRGELVGTLARVREAATLPWRDLTAATLAELRFDSIAGWLPAEEAAALRGEFHRELDRIYRSDPQTQIA